MGATYMYAVYRKLKEQPSKFGMPPRHGGGLYMRIYSKFHRISGPSYLENLKYLFLI